jgi:hypothetical protein
MNQETLLPSDILERLTQDPLDVEAAKSLAAASALPPAIKAVVDEVCGVLEGGERWREPASVGGTPRPLDKSLHESLVIHPREKQQRHHQLASLSGRILHLLDGNEEARAIARVTERAASMSYPRLSRLAAECARGLQMEVPDIHIARGEEWFCTVLLDKKPFLCVHRNWIEPEHPSPTTPPMTDAEARFALGHQIEHIKKGHTAFLQIGPTRLEALALDQVPFLVRTPIQLASKALGWTRANRAVKKMSTWMPEESAGQRIVETVGDLLPDQNQETLLPEVVHEWVRGWIQGVEFSADRAGLILSGSVTASCAALLRLSTEYSPQFPKLRDGGVRRLLQEKADKDRETSTRLLELLRFALSHDYLNFIAQHFKL